MNALYKTNNGIETHQACLAHNKNENRCEWFESRTKCEIAIQGDKLEDGIVCGTSHIEAFKGKDEWFETKDGYHTDRHWCCKGLVSDEDYDNFKCDDFSHAKLWAIIASFVLLVVMVFAIFKVIKQGRVKGDRVPFADLENDGSM